LRATVRATVDQVLARLREGNKIERIAREILKLVQLEIKVAAFLHDTVEVAAFRDRNVFGVTTPRLQGDRMPRKVRRKKASKRSWPGKKPFGAG
jgi:hypothetical protein